MYYSAYLVSWVLGVELRSSSLYLTEPSPQTLQGLFIRCPSIQDIKIPDRPVSSRYTQARDLVASSWEKSLCLQPRKVSEQASEQASKHMIQDL